jgi:hypothetical protein
MLKESGPVIPGLLDLNHYEVHGISKYNVLQHRAEVVISNPAVFMTVSVVITREYIQRHSEGEDKQYVDKHGEDVNLSTICIPSELQGSHTNFRGKNINGIQLITYLAEALQDINICSVIQR